MTRRYPKPLQTGGVLIRQVIASLDGLKVARPMKGPVRVAVSGGSDSVALAVLLARYGRRVVDSKDLEIIHLNHHWRGRESGRDQTAVRSLARTLGVPFKAYDLSPQCPKGRSLEEWGRSERQKVFNRFKTGVVLLAHHQDDQVETILWRVLTGAPRVQWAGMPQINGRLLRPVLGCTKADLLAFLSEEQIPHRVDRTNQDLRFLRTKIRAEVAPALDPVFPAWRRAMLALGAQQRQNR